MSAGVIVAIIIGCANIVTSIGLTVFMYGQRKRDNAIEDLYDKHESMNTRVSHIEGKLDA